jgi:large repetitive protein
VFDDANRNGVMDEGERGLANVRLMTVNGQLITTDVEGRYHIACADIPNEFRGSNYVLKVDPRTLPTGYRMTTENPLSTRITRGKMVKMNFGASIQRVIRIDMMNAAFQPATTTLNQKWQAGLPPVLAALQSEQAVLRIAYVKNGTEDPVLAQRRVDGLISYFRDAWAQQRAGYELMIETEVVGEGGPADTSVGLGMPADLKASRKTTLK